MDGFGIFCSYSRVPSKAVQAVLKACPLARVIGTGAPESFIFILLFVSARAFLFLTLVGILTDDF